MARSAGTQAQLVSREGGVALLKLPSAEIRRGFGKLHGDHRDRGQHAITKCFAGASRAQALDGQEPAQPRRFDESLSITHTVAAKARLDGTTAIP